MAAVIFPDGSRLEADTWPALERALREEAWNQPADKAEFREELWHRARAWSAMPVETERSSEVLFRDLEAVGLLRIEEEWSE